jgi:prevent-host-death family protein
MTTTLLVGSLIANILSCSDEAYFLYTIPYIHLSPGVTMAVSARDVIPLSQARANLSELADQVKAGAEKIVTKNGESYVAIIDAQRLDYYHQLERERIHLLLIDDAMKGLADVAAGNVTDARSALEARKRRRAEGIG